MLVHLLQNKGEMLLTYHLNTHVQSDILFILGCKLHHVLSNHENHKSEHTFHCLSLCIN